VEDQAGSLREPLLAQDPVSGDAIELATGPAAVSQSKQRRRKFDKDAFIKDLTTSFADPTKSLEDKKQLLLANLAVIEKHFYKYQIKRLALLPVKVADQLDTDGLTVFLETAREIIEAANEKFKYPKIVEALQDHVLGCLRQQNADIKNKKAVVMLFSNVLINFDSLSNYRKKRLAPVVRVLLDRSNERFSAPGEDIPALLAIIEKNFPPILIKKILMGGGVPNHCETHRALIDAQRATLPKVSLVVDELSTPAFQEILNKRQGKAFKTQLQNPLVKEVATLRLIRQLVARYDAARAPKNYFENRLEECLKHLMTHSNSLDGLNMEPKLLQECLRIINSYTFSGNIKKLFLARGPLVAIPGTVPQQYEQFPLHFYIQRCLRNQPDAFANCDKIQKLFVDPQGLPPQVPQLHDVVRAHVVKFNVQALFVSYLVGVTTEKNRIMAEYFLAQYPGEINVNAVIDEENGDTLLLTLIKNYVNYCLEYPTAQALQARTLKALDFLLTCPGLDITDAARDAVRASKYPLLEVRFPEKSPSTGSQSISGFDNLSGILQEQPRSSRPAAVTSSIPPAPAAPAMGLPPAPPAYAVVVNDNNKGKDEAVVAQPVSATVGVVPPVVPAQSIPGFDNLSGILQEQPRSSRPAAVTSSIPPAPAAPAIGLPPAPPVANDNNVKDETVVKPAAVVAAVSSAVVVAQPKSDLETLREIFNARDYSVDINDLVLSLHEEIKKLSHEHIQALCSRTNLRTEVRALLITCGFGAYLLGGALYRGSNIDYLEGLFEAGISVDAQCGDGNTALSLAVFFEYVAAVRWLLFAKGAVINEKVKQNAKEKNNSIINGILEEHQRKLAAEVVAVVAAEVAQPAPAAVAAISSVVAQAAVEPESSDAPLAEIFTDARTAVQEHGDTHQKLAAELDDIKEGLAAADQKSKPAGKKRVDREGLPEQMEAKGTADAVLVAERGAALERAALIEERKAQKAAQESATAPAAEEEVVVAAVSSGVSVATPEFTQEDIVELNDIRMEFLAVRKMVQELQAQESAAVSVVEEAVPSIVATKPTSEVLRENLEARRAAQAMLKEHARKVAVVGSDAEVVEEALTADAQESVAAQEPAAVPASAPAKSDFEQLCEILDAAAAKAKAKEDGDINAFVNRAAGGDMNALVQRVGEELKNLSPAQKQLLSTGELSEETQTVLIQQGLGIYLMIAIIYDEKASVANLDEFVKRSGIDVNSPDEKDMYPLHWAVQARKFAVVEYLVANGADVTVKKKGGGKRTTPRGFAERLATGRTKNGNHAEAQEFTVIATFLEIKEKELAEAQKHMSANRVFVVPPAVDAQLPVPVVLLAVAAAVPAKTNLERLCDAIGISSEGIDDAEALADKWNEKFVDDAAALKQSIIAFQAFVKTIEGQNLLKDAKAAEDTATVKFFKEYGDADINQETSKPLSPREQQTVAVQVLVAMDAVKLRRTKSAEDFEVKQRPTLERSGSFGK